MSNYTFFRKNKETPSSESDTEVSITEKGSKPTSKKTSTQPTPPKRSRDTDSRITTPSDTRVSDTHRNKNFDSRLISDLQDLPQKFGKLEQEFLLLQKQFNSLTIEKKPLTQKQIIQTIIQMGEKSPIPRRVRIAEVLQNAQNPQKTATEKRNALYTTNKIITVIELLTEFFDITPKPQK